jgi:hypothetical protein
MPNRYIADSTDNAFGGTWYTLVSPLGMSLLRPPLIEMFYIATDGRAWAVPLYPAYTVEEEQAVKEKLMEFSTKEQEESDEESDLLSILVPYSEWRDRCLAAQKKADKKQGITLADLKKIMAADSETQPQSTPAPLSHGDDVRTGMYL